MPSTTPAPSRGRAPCRGLTIVELLVVVGIVAVLAAIGLPAYARHVDRIRTQQAIVDIGALAARIAMHARETRDLPASLAAIGAAGQKDPWGRPYVYYNVEANGRGGARKDHALNPVNSDFDLYSSGPDGQSKPQISHRQSVDDLIRAGNGRFIGVAADF